MNGLNGQLMLNDYVCLDVSSQFKERHIIPVSLLAASTISTTYNYALDVTRTQVPPWCLHCDTLFVYNQLDTLAWADHQSDAHSYLLSPGDVKLNFMNTLL